MAKPGDEKQRVIAEAFKGLDWCLTPGTVGRLNAESAARAIFDAAIELAAQHFEEHYHCSECNPKEDFATELRALKGNAQGGK